MHRLRTATLVPLLATALALLLPQTALAWVSDGEAVFKRGPRNTIGYYAVGAASAGEAKEAVAAWNTSGAAIRLVPVKRAAAKIIVMPHMRDSLCFGVARTVFSNGVRVSSTIKRSACRSREDRVKILVHEFGHALGLDHETRRCAAMNTSMVDSVPNKCTDAHDLPKWRFYCAALEADDVRGMVARYGGRPRISTTRICERGPKPGVVSGLGATYAPTSESSADTTLSWTYPAGAGQKLYIQSTAGTCAANPGEWWGPGAELAVVAGTSATHTLSMAAGSYCFRFWIEDQWQQPSDTSYLDVTVPGTPFVPS